MAMATTPVPFVMWNLTLPELRERLKMTVNVSSGGLSGWCDHVPDRTGSFSDRTCPCGKLRIGEPEMRRCKTADDFVRLVQRELALVSLAGSSGQQCSSCGHCWQNKVADTCPKCHSGMGVTFTLGKMGSMKELNAKVNAHLHKFKMGFEELATASTLVTLLVSPATTMNGGVMKRRKKPQPKPKSKPDPPTLPNGRTRLIQLEDE